VADIFDTLNNYDRRLRQLETKPIKSPTATDDGVPAGGAQGEMLIKSSSIDYDTQWVEGIPTAGTTGQVLSKASGTNYDMQWIDGVPTGGAQGQVLTKSSATDYDMEWASPSTGTPSTVSLVASSSASSASGSASLVINMPTGVQEGDLVVIFCASENEAGAAPTLSSGWTTYLSATTSPSNIKRSIFYKFMTATPDTNATLTITSTNASAAIAYAFRGVETPTGFTHPIKSYAAATSTSGMPNPPSITTTYTNEFVFVFGALDDTIFTAANILAPTGFSNALAVSGGNATAGSNIMVMGAVDSTTTAGTLDPAAFTVSGATPSEEWVAYTMTFWRENGLNTSRKEIIVAASDETTALTTGTGKVTFRAPENMFLSSSHLPRASVTTAPTGAPLVVDIDAGSFSTPNTVSTIFSTTISIDISEFTSTTAATPCVLSTTFIPDDAQIRVDITQIGSTVAGAGLKVTLYYFIENS